MSYTPKNASSNFGHDKNSRKSLRISSLENQLEFKFDPWLYGFAATLTDPVKAYAHFVQPKQYSVSWNPDSKTMDFTGSLAKWGLENVKRYLGKEIFDHFGKVKFAIEGIEQVEKVIHKKPAKNEVKPQMLYEEIA